jgi:two-component system chemotaxis sensor kinase CheA
VVRDLAAQCGKKIELEMQGAGTELDKTIIEAIKDPLTHLVRNCCDHGIETPEVRAAKGKRPEGTIQLRAYHEGGVVNIEISDDGQGIDAERIRMKAVERGLLTPDQAARLSTREAIHLIFMPGFSTAAQVTSISGRGVGMDVVKNNIEKIGGSVEVLNRAPAGTTINIKIPLTLAIIPGLLITLWKPSGAPRLDDAGLAASTGSAPESPGRQVERRADPRAEPLVHFSGERRQRPEDRFIIPQVNLLELLHIEATEVATRVEQIHGTSILHHRGKLLPLINLSALLNRPEARRRRDDGISVVIVQAEQRQFGLVVDRICDTQEIVVKPLGRQLKSLTCYVGATIMGDGRPALILDVAGLARLAGLSAPPRRMAEDETKAVQGARSSQKLLLFCSGGFPRVAVPLSLVDRLEETDSRKIERAGGRLVLHYCNAILPLVTLEEVARGIAPELDPASKLQMIVFSDGTHRLGLIVDRILDIVDTEITARRGTCVPGLLGSALVDGAVTDLLDLQTVLAAAGESWSSGASSEALRPKQILLAESDRVARELLYRDLEVSDYEVVTAESAQETLQLLRQRPFDLVLTSLDLGRRDGGIDLLAQLKADAKLERLGVIGIHPQHSRGGQLRRMSLGEFDACIARGNRSEMLSTIEAVLSGRPVAVEAVA